MTIQTQDPPTFVYRGVVYFPNVCHPVFYTPLFSSLHGAVRSGWKLAKRYKFDSVNVGIISFSLEEYQTEGLKTEGGF